MSASVAPEGDPAVHRLWGGRFAEGPSAAFEALNRSIAVDFRLWPYDVELSKAWAAGLCQAGVLTPDESRSIDSGLDAVRLRLESGEAPASFDEDVHTLVDRLLHEVVGEVASKLHTGRSRNDQVATATRLWSMDASRRVEAAVTGLQQSLLEQARTLESTLMPSYTHLQRAMPVSGAHWLLSHFWPLERDRERLHAAARSAAVLPLGSGAVAGCAYPVPRASLQERLGFDALSPNSIDAVSDRDFVAELLFSASMIGVHVSRLAEDVIIFGTSEFGFVRFGDAFASGSSMMPQKRNPDALELARGSAARMLGALTTLLATLKGLPTSYNKDLQDDKRVLFEAIDTLLLVLPAVAGTIAECTFDSKRMRGALTTPMMATDLADYLVRKGVSFRDAHAAVGRLIRHCEEEKAELHTLPLASFKAAHPAFDQDAFGAISPRRSVEEREIDGGTGPTAVRRQIAAAQYALDRR